MKILVEIIIVAGFGIVGYLYRQNFKNRLSILKTLLDFVENYDSKLTLFKSNMHEIINDYVIMQKNKNANNFNLFQNINNIYYFNKKYFEKQIQSLDAVSIVSRYFDEMGKGEYEFEKEKNKNFKEYLKLSISKAEGDLNKKGNLGFKLFLLIGATVGILVW